MKAQELLEICEGLSGHVPSAECQRSFVKYSERDLEDAGFVNTGNGHFTTPSLSEYTVWLPSGPGLFVQDNVSLQLATQPIHLANIDELWRRFATAK